MTEQSLLERLADLPSNLVEVVRADSTSAALEAGLHALKALTAAQRAFVVMDNGGRPKVVTALGLDRTDVARAEFLRARRIVDYVLETGGAFSTDDLSVDERFAGDVSEATVKRSVRVLPLRHDGETLGAVYLDTAAGDVGWTVDTLRPSLHVAELMASMVHGARANRRMRLARDELRIENRALERMTNTLQEDVAAKSIEISQFERDLDSKTRALDSRFGFANIVGRSDCMRKLFEVLHQVMDYPVPILVTGESGTGKELIARALHQGSARANQPFMAINCAAIPETLLESELFGYKRGAFTGASTEKEGLFRAARSGTVFLDEIGELPAGLQAKLLRVLQEKEVRPIGGRESEPVEARIIAATNLDLRAEAVRGGFREDLYYRLNVVEVAVPPLRERREDIPALVNHVLSRLRSDIDFPATKVSSTAIRALMAHDWPGNVRELENCVKSAALLTSATIIEAHDLRLARPIDPPKSPLPSPATLKPAAVSSIRSREDWERHEREVILETLVRARWNKSRAAAELGMSRRNLYRKLARYGIEGGS